LGFLPKKPGDRKKILEKYKSVDGAKIVYESPFRLIKLVQELDEIYGPETEVAICREMTKKFEEIICGQIMEVARKIANKNIKGEIVVIFE